MFGCCPDQLTPASGWNLLGCSGISLSHGITGLFILIVDVFCRTKPCKALFVLLLHLGNNTAYIRSYYIVLTGFVSNCVIVGDIDCPECPLKVILMLIGQAFMRRILCTALIH